MRSPILLVMAALAMMLGAIGSAHAERRVALVIGNGAYLNTGALPNPANDGRAIAEALRSLDFTVLERIDQDQDSMQRAIREFARTLRGADVGLFYYAGHGLQVHGTNYLVPTDALLEDEADLAFETIDIDLVLAQLEREAPTSLVFLDACRDNPLARTLARGMGASRSASVGRGLARIESGLGTLIAYATQPDNVALDGVGNHSPFTQALLNNIATPGVEIRQMLTRVRQEVITETDRQQVPWDHSSLLSEFYFQPPVAEPPPESETIAVSPEPPSAPGQSIDPALEALFWETIQTSTAAADFEAYLVQFPDGVFAPLARNRLTILNAAVPQTSQEPAQSPAQGAEQASANQTAAADDGANGSRAQNPANEDAAPAVEPPPRDAPAEDQEPQVAVAAPPPEVDPAAEEAQIVTTRTRRREVQRALTVLGFNTYGVDGVFGPRTRTAISGFQRSRDFPVTGYLTPSAHEALMDEAREPLAQAAAAAAAAERQEPRQGEQTQSPRTEPAVTTAPTPSAQPPGRACRTEVTRIAGGTVTRPILLPSRRIVSQTRRTALRNCTQAIEAALNSCRSSGGRVIGNVPRCECYNAAFEGVECTTPHGSYSLTCEVREEPEVFEREICN